MAFNNNKGEIKFPYEIKFLDDETNKIMLSNFKGEKTGYVQVGPNKWIFPSMFVESADYFYNFQSRPDDVWVCTYPRSGTTWTQELVWLICNNLNYKKAQKVPLTQRFPFFEFHIHMHKDTKAEFLEENKHNPDHCQLIEDISVPCYEILDKIAGPRYIKTHLPLSLLPPSVFANKSKIIYVARNPKDVSVSWYHLNRLYRTQGYTGDFENFYNLFENDLTDWSPYWTHIKEGWNNRNAENILFMFYEDMNHDFHKTIQKVSEFLGKPVTDDYIPELADYLNIKNFKNYPTVNCQELRDVGILKSGEQGFVRNGKTGGHKEELTPEILQRINEWTRKNLQNTDLRFPQY
uniref:Putative sulfotransferase n=1 Tax=Corethrella appendiculata TaxID=1370023 RepID=U5EL28_9DIPT